MAHEHHHHQAISHASTPFVVGIVLNLAFVVVEAATGFYINSLSLLSDAVHNLTDVGTLALSLLAFRLLRAKPNDQFTYGYRKTSILVALLNSVILLVSVGGIVFEAIHKSFNPQPIQGSAIAIVAGVGIFINGMTAFLFAREKDKDINIRSAYLHLLADALVSAGIVVGGVIITFTSWYWIDTVLSMIVAVVILLGTWKLLKESLRLSLDGVPENIRLEDLRELALKIEGVRDIHHLHVWALSSTENAMTAHLVLSRDVSQEKEGQIKQAFRHELQHRDIQHITIETENEDALCDAKVC